MFTSGEEQKRLETFGLASSSSRTVRRLWRYIPLLVWMVTIFFASSDGFSSSNTSLIIGPVLRWLFPNISAENMIWAHFIVRKTAHFAEYALLALLAARAFKSSSHEWLRTNWYVASLLLVAVCALADEFHQSFLPTRTGSIYDSLLDIAGGATALTLLALMRSMRRQKLR